MIVRMLGLGGLIALMRMADATEQDGSTVVKWPNDDEAAKPPASPDKD